MPKKKTKKQKPKKQADKKKSTPTPTSWFLSDNQDAETDSLIKNPRRFVDSLTNMFLSEHQDDPLTSDIVEDFTEILIKGGLKDTNKQELPKMIFNYYKSDITRKEFMNLLFSLEGPFPNSKIPSIFSLKFGNLASQINNTNNQLIKELVFDQHRARLYRSQRPSNPIMDGLFKDPYCSPNVYNYCFCYQGGLLWSEHMRINCKFARDYNEFDLADAVLNGAYLQKMRTLLFAIL